MENRDRDAIEERKWRVRVGTCLLAVLVWGLTIAATIYLAFGVHPGHVLSGLLLLVLVVGGVAYYFGAGVNRIASPPSPSPEMAGRLGRRLAWVVLLVLAIAILSASSLSCGLFALSPTPRKELEWAGIIGVSCLTVLVAISVQRWRSALIKIGEGAADKRR